MVMLMLVTNTLKSSKKIIGWSFIYKKKGIKKDTHEAIEDVFFIFCSFAA
ncbi:hypothetical protein KMAL_32110 [Novacetimonas maltaceti]|uniref:Uncharacterized protein n=1 Tax=Novacetimonas maltaceti TaxID=1203393 RepID=A0A2S3VX29_9PROT|nr:hypothetical protein KMAL_32110 [Novacetimonas maltaceti]